MKNKIIIFVITIMTLISVTTIFYLTPKTLAKNVKLSDVNFIEVFDGGTGASFTINNPEDIKYIVENIQSHKMKKDGISFGKMGYGLKIVCFDDNNKTIIGLRILYGRLESLLTIYRKEVFIG